MAAFRFSVIHIFGLNDGNGYPEPQCFLMPVADKLHESIFNITAVPLTPSPSGRGLGERGYNKVTS